VEAQEKVVKSKEEAVKTANDTLTETKKKEEEAKKAFEGPPEVPAKKPEYDSVKAATKNAGEDKAKADADAKKQKEILESLKGKRDAAMSVSVTGDAKMEIANFVAPTQISEKTATALSVAVKEIVGMTFQVDEVVLKCIKLMGDTSVVAADKKFCGKYLDAMNAREELNLRKEAKELGLKDVEIQKLMDKHYD
jgi:hypothetical protein